MRIWIGVLLVPFWVQSQPAVKSMKAVPADHFTVTVLADSFPGKGRQLSYENRGARINDTGKVENGRLLFKGRLSRIDYATLYFFESPLKVRFLLEPGEAITIDLRGQPTFAGTRVQDEFMNWRREIDPLETAYLSLAADWRLALWEQRFEGLSGIENKMDSLLSALNNRKSQYIRTHRRSAVSGIMLAAMHEQEFNKGFHEMFQQLYALLDPQVRALPYVQKFRENLRKNERIAIGRTVPDFTLPDTLGNLVSTTHFRGQYTLIEFWASWCIPCRKESPLLVRTYQQFKDRGLAIISVSFDSRKDHWTKAIREDGFTWTNVSELKRWRNALNETWHISSIPDNILLDPSGQIIGRNLRGLRLEKKLEALFNGNRRPPGGSTTLSTSRR